MENQSAAKTLVSKMLGSWQGKETMLLDPSVSANKNVIGRFENKPFFSGMGVISTYQQLINDEIVIECATCFLFNDNNEMHVTWLGSNGRTERYIGQWRGAQFSFSGVDPDSSNQILSNDYSKDGIAGSAMRMKMADGSTKEVFSAIYEKFK